MESRWKGRILKQGSGRGGGGGVGFLRRAGGHTSFYWSGAFDPGPGKTEKNLEEAKLLPRCRREGRFQASQLNTFLLNKCSNWRENMSYFRRCMNQSVWQGAQEARAV